MKILRSLSVAEPSTPESNHEEHTTEHSSVLERILYAHAESSIHNVSHNLLTQNAYQHRFLETCAFESYSRKPYHLPL